MILRPFTVRGGGQCHCKTILLQVVQQLPDPRLHVKARISAIGIHPRIDMGTEFHIIDLGSEGIFKMFSIRGLRSPGDQVAEGFHLLIRQAVPCRRPVLHQPIDPLRIKDHSVHIKNHCLKSAHTNFLSACDRARVEEGSASTHCRAKE